MKNFNRQYKIFLGDSTGDPAIDGTVLNPLQVTFTVEQVFGGSVTYAEINVFNLNRDSRKKLLTRRSRKENDFEKIELWAGYEDNISMIFNGVIRNATKKTDGKNQIVTMYCRSSGVEYEHNTIEKTWGKNTPAKQIITDTAKAWGMPIKLYGDFDNLPKAIMGYSVSSDIKTELNKMAVMYLFSWDIENKKVIIIKDGADRGGNGFEFDSSSLLMNGTEVTEVGANVTIKMNPAILAFNKVKIKSESPIAAFSGVYDKPLPESIGDGEYKVYQITHKGDLYGSEWSTKLQCIRA